MRDRKAASAALVITLCLAWQAKADDPCQPAQTTGNPLAGLATLLGQQQRDRDCATLRQSQWAAYYAHQKSLQGGAAEHPQAAPISPPRYENNPQNTLQVMTRAVVAFGALRGLYVAAPHYR